MTPGSSPGNSHGNSPGSTPGTFPATTPASPTIACASPENAPGITSVLPTSVLDAAVAYTRRGWRVVPIAYRSKKITAKGWQTWRLGEPELAGHFHGPSNLGVLLGEPSGWLIDVDLDHPRAVALADAYLPPSGAVFGRPSKRRSHRLYLVTAPVATKKHRSPSAGMLVELRSTGTQTVFPPSIHECGEPITWDQDDPQPARIDPQVLLDAVQALADAVKIELGEKTAPRRHTSAQQTQEPTEGNPADADDRSPLPPLDPAQRFDLALHALRALRIVDIRDGSSRLYAAACRCVEHDLDDDQALACIRHYAQQQPFPRPWTDADILRRVRDAEQVATRGSALARDGEGLIRLGQRDPDTGKLVLSPRRTLPTAQAYLRDHHWWMHQFPTLRHYAGLFLEWHANHYQELEEQRLRASLYPWLHEALRYTCLPNGSMALRPFEANASTVTSAIDALRGLSHLDLRLTPPSWLTVSGGNSGGGGASGGRPPAHELLPCRSGLLHLPTMNRLAPTPEFFVTNALDYDPDPQATMPENWLRFLEQLWGDDLESCELLQEWFGYNLLADTRLQKMLLIVGPRRSGKGTLGRVLTHLVGTTNVAGPTTSSLAGAFGLQPLIGKSVAIVSDARFHGENILTVVERLLCISGEDTLTIDRKHLPSVTLKLPTRFTFFTNELPRLSDVSGALAGRFLVLRLTRSFYGQENPRLSQELRAEIPGILNWSIDGWRRLWKRGHFVQPVSALDAVQDLANLASPVGTFIRDRCVLGPNQRVWIDDLYRAWQDWCLREGRSTVTTKQTFGRDLAAVVPALRSRVGSGNHRFYEGLGLAEVACAL